MPRKRAKPVVRQSLQIEVLSALIATKLFMCGGTGEMADTLRLFTKDNEFLGGWAIGPAKSFVAERKPCQPLPARWSAKLVTMPSIP